MIQSPSQHPQAASLSSLRDRVKRNPKDGESWLAIALILARAEPGPELRQAIVKSIELLPDDYQAWLLAGLDAQYRQGPVAAQRWLSNIVQQNPGHVAARLAAAQLLTSSQAEAANHRFESIIKDFPDDSRAHLLFAEHLQNQGRVPEAADKLEQSLKIKSDVAENWAALAMLRLAENRYGEVVIAASKALELDPAAVAPRLSRAKAYCQAAQWDRGLSDYREIDKSMPDNPFVLLGLGACLAGLGEFDEALHVLRKALQIKPDLAELKLDIALVLASLGRIEDALNDFEVLLRASDLPKTVRETVVIAQTVLQENRRLESIIKDASESGDITGLQHALLQAPEVLLQTDSQTNERLQAMAQACQKWVVDDVVTDGASVDPLLDPVQIAFVEACLLCRAADKAVDMANIWRAIHMAQSNVSLLDEKQRNVFGVWRSVLDRGHLPIALNDHSKGEAWLRYWHFRVLHDKAAALPGFFKFSRNSIGVHQTTAPQYLIESVRMLMNETAPGVPAGEARAVYMLAAINEIHAFTDGNGRLARFVFNRELQQAGLQTILFFPDMRKTMTECLQAAQYQNDFKPFQQALLQARSGTKTLLKEFNELLGSG